MIKRRNIKSVFFITSSAKLNLIWGVKFLQEANTQYLALIQFKNTINCVFSACILTRHSVQIRVAPPRRNTTVFCKYPTGFCRIFAFENKKEQPYGCSFLFLFLFIIFDYFFIFLQHFFRHGLPGAVDGAVCLFAHGVHFFGVG